MTTSTDACGEFTRLLEQVRDGDPRAFDRLVAVDYDTVKEVARRDLSGRRRGAALCTTALVHVDHARRGKGAKRGGDEDPITLTAGHAAVQPSVVDVLALDQALDRLGELNERLRRIVEYLF